VNRIAPLLLLAACTSRPAAQPSVTTSGTSTTTPSSPTSAGSDATSTSSDETLGHTFITAPDGLPEALECSTFEQDCPRGEKCNTWANDGGSAWNATRCVPVDPDPDALGEPCTVTDSGVSGLDSCEVGAMCWDIDFEAAEGTCVEHCRGEPTTPQCQEPDTRCVFSGSGALALCLPGA